ncbi:hypothetical protein Bpfe_021402 [Biomphalaria pfeifferi]|uniref:Uncharacterized protein n=1 Tax=Biomphalaria pfeifferi TaxID=112525 RepID=A0AAD8B6U6_BIOPF|nr:hypothetical protein Bpfe_021402 [Biomphalaria pfeifferi]
MSTKATVPDEKAVFHEINPKTVLIVRIVNAITLIMILIAVIACFVQGHKNSFYYLLVCNLIISILVYLVVNWWYRTGDLGSEKYWFVLLLNVVIIFQCISTDTFVFKVDSAETAAATTPTSTPTKVAM